jgi:Flp pilus assembly protein TadG
MARWRRADEGTSAVEFGIIAPFLAALVVPLIDVGMAFYQQMQVRDAAQAGTQYAMVHGWNSSAIQNAVTNATTLASLSASPAPILACGCPSGSSVDTAACTATCNDSQPARTYVTVSAQATYTTFIPYPGLSQSVTLTAQSTVRIR